MYVCIRNFVFVTQQDLQYLYMYVCIYVGMYVTIWNFIFVTFPATLRRSHD